MGTQPLTSAEGDTLDLLLWRERGFGPNDLAPVLDLNPGLAAQGAMLPAGTLVAIPARVAGAVPTLEIVQLWT